MPAIAIEHYSGLTPNSGTPAAERSHVRPLLILAKFIEGQPHNEFTLTSDAVAALARVHTAYLAQPPPPTANLCAPITPAKAMVLARNKACTGDSLPVFHPLAHLDDSDLADLLQVIRVRVLNVLERRGIVESRPELTLLEDDLAEREPALAQLASAAVSGLLPAGPFKTRVLRRKFGELN